MGEGASRVFMGGGVKIVSVFNNKGGVGKTTLTFHLAHALAAIGKRVLLIDLDPQCNLSIYALEEEEIAEIWLPEDNFIDDFESAQNKLGATKFSALIDDPRSIHFLLKPVEDGVGELNKLPPPIELKENLHLIAGRLSLHLFESKVAERWSGVYTGDPLSIRTATRIRAIAKEYSDEYDYDIVILDTSPSLGALNRNILSQADGFLIPGNPDLFSLYGIRNIGSALKSWKKQFESIFHFLPDSKRENFPDRFVRFLGFTLYNAKRLQGSKTTNKLGIAKAHFNYAKAIPKTIFESISSSDMVKFPIAKLQESIGDGAVIHGHNTLPSMAMKYHLPMWELPSSGVLDSGDMSTIQGNRQVYEVTGAKYQKFARDLVARIEAL